MILGDALKALAPILKWLLQCISPTGGKLIAAVGIIGGLGHFFAPVLGMERPPISIAFGFLFLVFVGIIFGTRSIHKSFEDEEDEEDAADNDDTDNDAADNNANNDDDELN